MPRPATGNTALVIVHHGSCLISEHARNRVSSSTATPSSRALSSLRPASAPATTKSVFFDTEPATLPPRGLDQLLAPRRASCAGSVPVSTKVLPASGPRSRPRAGAPSAQRTPAARSCSITSRLCGSAKKRAIARAPPPGRRRAPAAAPRRRPPSARRGCRSGAPGPCAVASPTLRMPSAKMKRASVVSLAALDGGEQVGGRLLAPCARGRRARAASSR